MRQLTDLLAGQENFKRAIEIALAGSHSLSVYENNIYDANTLAEFVCEKTGLHLNANGLMADIVIELSPVHFDQLMLPSGESYEAIIARARQGQERKGVDTDTNKSAEALLKHGFDRGMLKVTDINIIISVAGTIAKLDNSTIVRADHIAEAMQYRMNYNAEPPILSK